MIAGSFKAWFVGTIVAVFSIGGAFMQSNLAGEESGASGRRQGQSGEAIAPESHPSLRGLDFPIVLTDVHGGFVGMSGYIWTIERDGSWNRQRYVIKPKSPADQQGRLSRGQLASLAGTLAANDFAALPDTIGKTAGANPHLITLAVGNKKSMLQLGAGKRLPPVDPNAGSRDPQNRFVSSVQAVLELVAAKNGGPIPK